MYRFLLSSLVVLLTGVAHAEDSRLLALHPDNPHYLLFRGRPTILVTSGEHYGAVLNGDFAYERYLDELKAHDLNLTRTFSGTYFEIPGSFHIVDNTLAPTPEKYIGPWPRSDKAGAADGSNKFDLSRWNPAYFQRLRDFVHQADRRGIVVELVLFCPFYEERLWHVNPLRSANNINAIGKCSRTEVYALKEKALTAVQEAVARKIVAELQEFDNVYFEICNEPYFGGVTLDWQKHMAAVIVQAEKDRPRHHLIAQNIANGSAKIANPNPQVSIFNFHYAAPPTAVGINYHLQRPLGDDETGFRGTGDRVYRAEGWDFLLAGGAIYSNLDYSFSCKHPDGTFTVKTSPGGGGRALRQQLGYLKKFLESFDFVRLKPDNAVLRRHKLTPAPVPAGQKPAPAPTVRVLAERGRQYAIYLHGGVAAQLTLDLPAGKYQVQWLNPRRGQVERRETMQHAGGECTLTAPAYTEDLALAIRRQ